MLNLLCFEFFYTCCLFTVYTAVHEKYSHTYFTNLLGIEKKKKNEPYVISNISECTTCALLVSFPLI